MYDEKVVLDTLEISKSVVKINTTKFVHNIFYQAVPVGGIASGIIIKTDGLILTNNHVVGTLLSALAV